MLRTREIIHYLCTRDNFHYHSFIRRQYNIIIFQLFTIRGNVSGNEPASMVCKISGNNKRDLSFVWRFIGYVMYGPWEDHFNRHETAFYQLVAPHLKDTSFRYPKVYFAGK